eukprot:194180_1
MADLDKQAKYYESLLRRFKLDEQKWIARQREIHKEKNIVIKYVFVDDIRKLKIYKDQTSRARIQTFEGHEVIVKDIEVTSTTEYDEIADEVLDKLMVEIEDELHTKKRRKYDNYGTAKLEDVASGKSGKSMGSPTKKRKKKKKTKDGQEDEDGSEMMSPTFDDLEEMKDIDDIYGDIEHEEDYIDSCFHELMREITEKTRDLERLNATDEDIEVLLEAIQERHELIQKTLDKFQYEYVDEFPEMNQKWQDQIKQLIEKERKHGTQEAKQKDPVTDTDVEERIQTALKQRTDVLLKVIDVLNNEQPKALLDEIIQRIDNQPDEEWKTVLHELGKIKSNIAAISTPRASDTMDDSQFVVANEMVSEMSARQQDLESLRKCNENDMEPQEEIDNICDMISKRHAIEVEKLQQIIGEDEETEFVSNVKSNNDAWLAAIYTCIEDHKKDVDNRKKNQYHNDELNGRIADLLKLIDIYNICKSTKPDLVGLKSKFNSFVTSIRDRHQFNHENNANDVDATENDRDWSDNIFGLASKISGLKAQDVGSADDTNASNEADDSKEDEEIAFDAANWWLNKDENRNDTVDEITIDEQQQCGELYEGVMYLWRLLYYGGDDDEKADGFNDVITSLYFPVPEIFRDNEANKHNMIATLYDGVVFCKFINKVRDGYMDMRVVEEPNAFNPFPISDEAVLCNMQLVISCAQSLGIQLTSYDISEWIDPNHWVQYAIDLMNALSTMYLNRRFRISKNKELVRLVKNNEDPDTIRKLSGQEWLQRWCNYLNNKPVLEEIAPETYNNELFLGMKLNTDEVEEFDSDPSVASQLMIGKHSDVTNVSAEDLCNGNRKLQDLFAADVYEHASGLDPLSDSEKREFKSLLKGTSKSKKEIDRYAGWINTALSPSITIVSLLDDLSSGYILLKLLDKSQPGCVSWRNVRKKIRHKFDKVNNCNLVMKICDEELGFSLVGMAGSDIVDGNDKFINSLLSQLMRCYATRQLSAALFKNAKSKKVVTDADILQWVNLTIAEFGDAQSKEITSFKDRVLSTCIIYIELLAAIKPDEVDLGLCNYDVKPLVNNKVIDKQHHERSQNALYSITLIRKFGGELFVIPNYLCQMEYKSVLGVFAAIMTISMTNDNKK